MKETVIICIGILLSACVKDKPVKENQRVQWSNSKKVFVVNEGNFGSGNASVSVYDPSGGNVVENIFESVNGGALGDVAQSIANTSNKRYLVINNSAKVVVCDLQFKKLGEIRGLNSPRYLLPVSNQKAYVSDLYANAIHIVDLNSNLKIGSIPCRGWTEQMTSLYNSVFVTNLRSAYVYLINAGNDKISDSVFVGYNAASLLIDQNDKLWVLAAGDSSKSNLPRLSKINTTSLVVERYFEFPKSSRPGNLCCNAGKDSLYYLNNGIYRFVIGDLNLPQNPLISNGNKNFYGLGIDPLDGTIYASDALDYSQRSNIYIYGSDGNQRGIFKAGINANGFNFE